MGEFVLIYTLTLDERAALVTDWCMETMFYHEDHPHMSLAVWFSDKIFEPPCRLYGDAALDISTDDMQIEAESDSELVMFKLKYLC